MMAGNGPDPLGFVIVTEKEMDLPESETWIVKVLPEYEAVTLEGFPGSVPSSYFCSNELSSACRHFQSALVWTLVPPANVKGSGSVVTEAPRLPGIAGQVVPPVDVVVVVVTIEVVRVVTTEVVRLPVFDVELIAVEVVEGVEVVDAAPGRH